MDERSYLEKYSEEHSNVAASVTVNKRIFKRLLGFLICSVIYAVIYGVSKFRGLHDIQTQFLNTFVSTIMICSYIIALVFLICYILVCISKNIKERLDQVSFKIKKMFFFTVDWLVILPVCATVASFCFAFLFTFAQVDGDSMLPNIENESTVFVSYLDKVDRFDVVVAYINSSDYVNVGVNTSEYYIKRVIGLPGDQITLVKGVLTIKGNEYETSTVVDEYYFSKETLNNFKLYWKEDYNFDGEFTYIEDKVKYYSRELDAYLENDTFGYLLTLNGDIKVYYKGTKIQKISLIISLLSIICLIIYILKNKSFRGVKMNKNLDKILTKIFNKIGIRNKDTQKLLIKIFKFVIVGGIATLISGIIFFLCDHYLKTSVLISNTIAFIISVIYNFWASCKYVFNVDKNKNKARIFTEFIVFALLGYFLTQFLLWLMADVLKWNHMLAWLIATIIVMVFNFITRQIFLEKKPTK